MRLEAPDERGREALRPSGPAFNETAELLSDMPAPCDRAAPEERRRLVAPLMHHTLKPTADPEVVLIPPDPAEGMRSEDSEDTV